MNRTKRIKTVSTTVIVVIVVGIVAILAIEYHSDQKDRHIAESTANDMSGNGTFGEDYILHQAYDEGYLFSATFERVKDGKAYPNLPSSTLEKFYRDASTKKWNGEGWRVRVTRSPQTGTGFRVLDYTAIEFLSPPPCDTAQK